MGELQTVYELRWRMKLSPEGYASWEFLDDLGRRWGWAVNVAVTGWTAHVGDWGQASLLGLTQVPLGQEINRFPTSTEARGWIEDRVAEAWQTYVLARRA